MEYKNALNYIHGLLTFGTRPGLERVSALLERMGNPHKKLKFIHVAGTNGKGSTCEMLNRILQQAGYRTGMFTSPYVIDFRERMQVNSGMIPEEALPRILEGLLPLIEALAKEGLQPTEFEVVTAIAMQWFFEEQCDVVVLEVGLGGSIDSTNVIDTPLLSVLTSISFDHMNLLGNTLREIAEVKCGIIKPGGLTVASGGQYPEAQAVIAESAKAMGNPLLIPCMEEAAVLSRGEEGTRFTYEGLQVRLPLLGDHQVKNALTVITAARALNRRGLAVPDACIVEGIRKARIPARMELLSHRPLVMIDGAHNEDGAKALAEGLSRWFGGKRVHAVMGMMGDKEYEKALALLAPHCTSITTTRPSNPRALPPEELAGLARAYCADVRAMERPKDAFDAALARLGEGDLLLVCGSLYLASDLRGRALEKTK